MLVFYLAAIDNDESKNKFEWKSVAPDICDMLFSMPPNMFAFGVLHSRPILKRSVLRESITMLPSLMLLKSW